VPSLPSLYLFSDPVIWLYIPPHNEEPNQDEDDDVYRHTHTITIYILLCLFTESAMAYDPP